MQLDFVSAYILTLAVETIVLYLILRERYPSLIIVRNSIIASSLTLPFVWFVFPPVCIAFGFSWAVQVAASELFAFAAEAGIYKLLFDKISWKDAVVASFVCNLLSFVAGLL